MATTKPVRRSIVSMAADAVGLLSYGKPVQPPAAPAKKPAAKKKRAAKKKARK